MVTFTMLTCGQSSGLSKGGIRPVLILQNNVGNRHSPTVIAAPHHQQDGKTAAAYTCLFE